ncbi:VOC family protein [Roseovarius sp. EL26]|uniref:VOC family protein n=1 Tax=Roseovarius sp. EL26 TaxID=2126672 RepID=UPI001C1FDBB0|nr:VOC family protein [Roseovarius sp. EL26]
MALVDHLSLGASNIERAKLFYDAVLNEVGISAIAGGDGFVAYGQDRIEFLILQPFNEEIATGGNGTHVAFAAPSEEAVKAAHAAGLANGARDEGAPGPRDAYPMPVFTAFLRDPDGNKVEIIHNGFSTA